MAVTERIKPSPKARQLFNKMVVFTIDGHLTLGQALALGIKLHRSGEDAQAGREVAELVQEEWIRPAEDGGWHLG